ncbi:BufA1 family periplasmic bufferin-type metallophore [Pelagibius marinus]|uniref:BufA1 family periplasmic bufferin-type metallophore n=1 Tax=Pelagibius marinus TaxID=2762760 RepID=UPI001872C2DE|nr:DUF2282 domain-containing protein [Pelagibius marinus]
MKTATLVVAASLVGAATLPAVFTSEAQGGPAAKPDFKFEKCFGVVKAGSNDCQTATSSCAGTSRRDGQADAWIYLPAGSCAKIAGGSIQPKKG